MLRASDLAEYILKEEGITNFIIKKTRSISRVRPSFNGAMKVYLKDSDNNDKGSLFIAAHEASHVINIKNEVFYAY